MTFVAVFLVNAVLSFALSLLVAHLVGPEAFGRYAVALSVSVVINTVSFEWLRLSTTRFYSERVCLEEPRVGATLDLAYAVSSAVIVLVTGIAIVSGGDFGLSPGLLAAASAVGLTVGLFDYRTAQARARFLDRRYAALLLTRGTLAFALAAGAGWIWADPTLVLVGSAAAAVTALVVVPRDRGTWGAGAFDRAILLRFARYALPLIAASAIYQVLPLMNRAILAGRSGFAEAGYFSLASEIAVRLFQNLGSALDLALFQLAVRAEERGGREAGERQVAVNLGRVFALLLPASIGLCAVWPSFEALFVPASFRGEVGPAMMLAVPAFAAYALVQYGFNPIFQIRHRTGPVIAAAIVAFAVDAAILLLWPGAADAVGVAGAQFAALAAGLLAIGGLALASRAPLPWRDIACAVAASLVMAAALWPWRQAFPPALGLGAQAIAGAVIYACLAWLLDIAGARVVISALLARGRQARDR